MTMSEVPQWLQTVHAKRLVRENAINSYLDSSRTRPEILQLDASGRTKSSLRDVTDIDGVADTLQAIASGAVSASTLCAAHVYRRTALPRFCLTKRQHRPMSWTSTLKNMVNSWDPCTAFA
ncbi:Amidase [Ascochyta lentis]